MSGCEERDLEFERMRAMNGGKVRIIVRFSAAVPLWHLALYALVLFVASFCFGVYTRGLTRVSAEPVAQAPVTNPAAAAVSQPVASGGLQVIIRNMQYLPATLEIKRGDTVEWRNDDITPHTVTSASFDSGSIDPDAVWRYTFNEAGEFPYICTFHPDMKGSVRVQ